MRYLQFMLLVIGITNAYAETEREVVFEGFPITTVVISGGQTPDSIQVTHHTDDDKRMKMAVRIIKDGDDYLWASHGYTPLRKVETPTATTYVAINGKGYIKVNTAHGQTIYGEDFPFDYIEHWQSGFLIVTNLGSSKR